MLKRVVGSALVVGLCLALPGVVDAQDLSIDHTAVGCIVAGEFPELSACFEPASSLANARAYFRVENTEDWYYVELAPEAPCHAGSLPKPGKELIDKRLEYYVQGIGTAFNEGQTETYAPLIVATAGDCGDLRLAPIGSAPAAVFPAVPAGFATTAFPLTTVIVGAGAAAAGGAGLALTGGEEDPPLDSTLAGTPTTQPTVVTPTTTATTVATTLPPVNQPPNAVFKVDPDPPEGDAPLTVKFDMCLSKDPEGDKMFFNAVWGDGAANDGSCVLTNTYAAVTFGPSGPSLGQDRICYNAKACVKDEFHEAECMEYQVCPSGVEQCSTDTQPPSVQLTSPSGYYGSTDFPVPFRANATDPGLMARPSGVGVVRYFAQEYGTVYRVGESRRGPDWAVDLSAGSMCAIFGPYFYGDVWAEAEDACGRMASSSRVSAEFDIGRCWSGPAQSAQASRLTWTSQLDVPGGRGQTVLNGRTAFYPGEGRSMGAAPTRRGTNRLEAQLATASGPGTWRFDFLAGFLEPGSLRVVAGDVAELSSETVVFKIRGEPGERVVFTFRPKR